MLKVLWVAAENEGEEEEFNDCPFWLNLALIGGAKFRWAPFLDNYGITLKAVKTQTDVADKDDQNGAPINKIGSFRPGEDSDEAWCRIITNRERYNGEWKPSVKTWLPYDAEEDDGAYDEADDEEPEEEDEEEPEPEPEPEPARGRGRRSAPARSAPDKAAAPARGTRTRAATPAPEKPAPARGTKSSRTAAAPAKAAAPARGRGRGKAAAGYDDEPPF